MSLAKATWDFRSPCAPPRRAISDARRADLGWDGGERLGDLLLVRRDFGSGILPMWRWRATARSSPTATALRRSGSRSATKSTGRATSAFEVLVGCAADDECEGAAWVPVYNVRALLRALTGQLMHDLDVYCTVPGPHEDNGQGGGRPRGPRRRQPAPAHPGRTPGHG
ncbi:hypothetical protein GCM10020254_84620 [Streptomyces goshikiensis]